MVDNIDRDYIAGEDVTRFARPAKPSGTIVLSLRLPGEEFVALSKLADAEGKNIAQVAREGIRARLAGYGATPQTDAAFSVATPEGSHVSVGPGAPSTLNDAAAAEVEPAPSQAAP